MEDRRKKESRREGIQFKLPKDNRKNSDRRKKERRIKERIPVKMWIRNIDANASYFQQTGNLSVGGMYILSPNPYPINTIIQIEFQVPGTNHVVNCEARVLKYSQDGQLIGLNVQFVNMKDDDRQIVNRAVGSS